MNEWGKAEDIYEYMQDESGRTVRASGKLEFGEADRNYIAQLEAGGEFRRESDEGGHLIGHRFGGTGDVENLVAENRTLNRSGFKTLENEWAKELENEREVYVDIYPEYQDETERPYSIWGDYTISDLEGNQTKEYFSFTNEDLTAEEFELPEEADELLEDYKEYGGETDD